jgi:thiaminase/transcriptional activator TenA
MRRREFLALAGGAAALGASEARFTDELWAAIEGIFQKTLRHPFLAGLSDGTLPRGKFDFYLAQDSLYLTAFAQALGVLSSKAPDDRWRETLAQHAIDAIRGERELHEKLLQGKRADKMAPTNAAYTNHLLAGVYRLSFCEGLAAMLPCYWIYWEVGKELVKRGSKDADYQRWIDQYASASYGDTVNQVLRMMNVEAARAAAPARESAKELFVRSARYEYQFWDMAWREEQWVP